MCNETSNARALMLAIEATCDQIHRLDPLRNRAAVEILTAKLEDLRSIIAICSQNLPLVRT